MSQIKIFKSQVYVLMFYNLNIGLYYLNNTINYENDTQYLLSYIIQFIVTFFYIINQVVGVNLLNSLIEIKMFKTKLLCSNINSKFC